MELLYVIRFVDRDQIEKSKTIDLWVGKIEEREVDDPSRIKLKGRKPNVDARREIIVPVKSK